MPQITLSGLELGHALAQAIDSLGVARLAIGPGKHNSCDADFGDKPVRRRFFDYLFCVPPRILNVLAQTRDHQGVIRDHYLRIGIWKLAHLCCGFLDQ